MALQQCPKEAGAHELLPKAGELRNWPAGSGQPLPGPCPAPVPGTQWCIVGWGQNRGTGRRPRAGGQVLLRCQCCSIPSPGRYRARQREGPAKDGLEWGASVFPDACCVPSPAQGWACCLFLRGSRATWPGDSCRAAWLSVWHGGLIWLPKAVCPAWVEALCHRPQWKSPMESKFSPCLSPTSWKSFPFPAHPVIRGREGRGPAVLPPLPFSSRSLLSLPFLAVLICIDSDFLAHGGLEAEAPCRGVSVSQTSRSGSRGTAQAGRDLSLFCQALPVQADKIPAPKSKEDRQTGGRPACGVPLVPCFGVVSACVPSLQGGLRQTGAGLLLQGVNAASSSPSFAMFPLPGAAPHT